MNEQKMFQISLTFGKINNCHILGFVCSSDQGSWPIVVTTFRIWIHWTWVVVLLCFTLDSWPCHSTYEKGTWNLPCREMDDFSCSPGAFHARPVPTHVVLTNKEVVCPIYIMSRHQGSSKVMWISLCHGSWPRAMISGDYESFWLLVV